MRRVAVPASGGETEIEVEKPRNGVSAKTNWGTRNTSEEEAGSGY